MCFPDTCPGIFPFHLNHIIPHYTTILVGWIPIVMARYSCMLLSPNSCWLNPYVALLNPNPHFWSFLWVEFQFLSVEAPVFNICHVQSSSLLLLNPHFCRLNHPCSGMYSPFLQVRSPFLLVESPFFMVQCRPDPCQRRSVRNHFGAPLRRWFATNSLQQWWGRCTASSWRGTSRADTWADLITSIDLIRFYFDWLSDFDNYWSDIWTKIKLIWYIVLIHFLFSVCISLTISVYFLEVINYTTRFLTGKTPVDSSLPASQAPGIGADAWTCQDAMWGLLEV